MAYKWDHVNNYLFSITTDAASDDSFYLFSFV